MPRPTCNPCPIVAYVSSNKEGNAMRIFALSSLSLAAALASGSAYAAPEILAGPACGPSGPCLTFSSAGGLPATIRSISFTAPSAGTVSISVNGSMQCINNEPTEQSNRGVVDVVTQIVKGNVAVVPNDPGSVRFAMRIPFNTLNAFSYPVNLAATRVLPVSQGANSFRLKMVALRVDPATSCTVLNAQMSLVFVP